MASPETTAMAAGIKGADPSATPGALLPLQTILLTALVSCTGEIFAVLQAWPLWAMVLVTLLPWAPLFVLDTVRTYRPYPWLALFYVLVVAQTGHFLEHVVQMTQIHTLDVRLQDAHGVFGALDIEWVHFLWNAWVGVVGLLLLTHFRRNPWLWLVVLIAGWHAAEHTYILAVYLASGTAGTPGFLARGGALAGGLPLIRPDLHFGYNLIETAPLLLAFFRQCKHTTQEQHDAITTRATVAASASGAGQCTVVA